MTDKSVGELEARRSFLLKELKRIGPLVEGSIATPNRRCGNPNCHCAHGEPHKAMILCKKIKGKSHATYVPVDLHEKVREWNEEHKRVKELLKEISDISEAIIRGYSKSNRAVKRKRKSLKIVDGHSKNKGK